MEQSPSFKRIIGGTEEDRLGLAKRAQEASLKTGEEIYGENLVIPTEEEKKAIDQAVQYANAVVQKYGVTEPLTADRIFLVKKGSLGKTPDAIHHRGFYNSYNQSIAVDRIRSTVALSEKVVHELLHKASYQAAQIFEDETHGSYRSGIAMQGREKEHKYFSIAEEAIIATLAGTFFSDVIAKDPAYADQLDKTKEIKVWINGCIAEKAKKESATEIHKIVENIFLLPNVQEFYERIFNSDKGDDYKLAYFIEYYRDELNSGELSFERLKERTKFNEVLENIIKLSNGKIDNKQELFDDFARAHFTGNYMPLARKIEDALGEGSFRKIATELGDMNTTEEIKE